MPNELAYTDHTLTGLTTYYAVLQQGATVVKASDGSSLALSSANWQSAAIALSDTGHAGHYLASVPSGTAAGRYKWRVYQASGTPSSTAAITDEEISGEDVVDWSGSTEVTLNGVNVTAWRGTTVATPTADGYVPTNAKLWDGVDIGATTPQMEVGGYAAGQDPATLILTDPAAKLTTQAETGYVTVTNTSAQAIAEAVGEAGGLSTAQESTLTAIYNATGRITQGNIIVTAGTRNGVLAVHQSHTYADSTALQITQPDGTWPDLASYPTNGISLTLTLTPAYTNHAVYLANTNVGRVTITGATVTGTFAATNQAVAFRPGTVTATLVPTTQGYPKQPYDAQVWAVSGTNSKLLFDGMAPVTKDIRS
jgi:hypothetical protein